jgi:hypothetical protein
VIESGLGTHGSGEKVGDGLWREIPSLAMNHRRRASRRKPDPVLRSTRRKYPACTFLSDLLRYYTSFSNRIGRNGARGGIFGPCSESMVLALRHLHRRRPVIIAADMLQCGVDSQPKQALANYSTYRAGGPHGKFPVTAIQNCDLRPAVFNAWCSRVTHAGSVACNG